MTTSMVKHQSSILSPAELVETANLQCKYLMDIVDRTKCYQNISGKKYLQVEAWETIGAFNQVHAVTSLVEPIKNDDKEAIGYLAHVDLYRNNEIVGGATMPCFFTENACKGKDGDAKHKACMSAAQTFATSKAYRMNYSYVAILAGYEPTPAEEMAGEYHEVKKETDQGKYYCKEHGEVWFKKGKMKNYAHPIKDTNGNSTGEWCNMPSGEPSLSPQSEIAKDEAQETLEDAAREMESYVDLDWARENLEKAQWVDVGKWLRETFKVNGSRVSDMLRQLTKEEAEQFTKKLQERIDLL